MELCSVDICPFALVSACWVEESCVFTPLSCEFALVSCAAVDDSWLFRDVT